MKVKSINYTRKELVELVDVDCHEPNAGEVQIEGLACGVCAWDVHVFKNGSDWPVWPGHEGLGQVIKLGPGVTKVKEGDWVTGIGLGFTQVYNKSEHELFVVPRSSDSRAQDWIVEPVSCVVTGIDHCKILAGDKIAIVGCGFMGMMFVQALSHSLLERLIVIDVDPDRLAMAKKFGAPDVY